MPSFVIQINSKNVRDYVCLTMLAARAQNNNYYLSPASQRENRLSFDFSMDFRSKIGLLLLLS